MSWPDGDYFVFHTWCKSLSVMTTWMWGVEMTCMYMHACILGIPLYSMMQWVIHRVQLGILCFQQSTVDHRAGKWWKTSRDLTCCCILLQSIWNLCNERAEKPYEIVLCWLNGLFALHVDWQTPVEDVPLAIAPFQGRVLVGVGKLLRIYDLGKKKLLRKCENKVRPSTYTFVWRCFFFTASFGFQTNFFVGSLWSFFGDFLFLPVGIGVAPFAPITGWKKAIKSCFLMFFHLNLGV